MKYTKYTSQKLRAVREGFAEKKKYQRLWNIESFYQNTIIYKNNIINPQKTLQLRQYKTETCNGNNYLLLLLIIDCKQYKFLQLLQ